MAISMGLYAVVAVLNSINEALLRLRASLRYRVILPEKKPPHMTKQH